MSTMCRALWVDFMQKERRAIISRHLACKIHRLAANGLPGKIVEIRDISGLRRRGDALVQERIAALSWKSSDVMMPSTNVARMKLVRWRTGGMRLRKGAVAGEEGF